MEISNQSTSRDGYMNPTNELELIDRLDECIGLSEEQYLIDKLDREILKAEEEDLIQRLLENIEYHEMLERRQRNSLVTHVETPSNNNLQANDSDINWIGFDNSSIIKRRQKQNQLHILRNIPPVSDVERATLRLVKKLPKYLDESKTKIFTRGEFHSFVLSNWIETMEQQCPPEYRLRARLLEDSYDNDPYAYSLVVTGPSKDLRNIPKYSQLLENLRQTSKRWIETRIHAYNAKKLLGDGESLLFDIALPAKEPFGASFDLRKYRSQMERKSPPEAGIMMTRVTEDTGISKVLGSPQPFQQGFAIIAINGQPCTSQDDLLEFSKQHKQASSATTVTVCLSKYADLSGIDLTKHPPRRRDLKPFDINYYNQPRRYKTPIKSLPIEPPISTKAKQSTSDSLVNDKNSIVIRIILSSEGMKKLGVTFTKTSNGIWLSKFEKGEQFYKILGSHVSTWGGLLTEANGVSLKTQNPFRRLDDIVASAYPKTFRATIVVFDGTDLSELDKSSLVEDTSSLNPRRLDGSLYLFEEEKYEAEEKDSSLDDKAKEDELLINKKKRKASSRSKSTVIDSSSGDDDDEDYSFSVTGANDDGEDDERPRQRRATGRRIEEGKGLQEVARKRKAIESRRSRTGDSSDDGMEIQHIPKKRSRLHDLSDASDEYQPLRQRPQVDKLANYERFMNKYKPFVDAEYHRSTIHPRSILSSMWTQHKKIYGDEHLCDDACNCFLKLSKLSKNVIKDYTTKQEKEHKTLGSIETAGIANIFAPRFIGRLKHEYPNLTPSEYIHRLILLWQCHHDNPTLGIQCNDRCVCHQHWDDFFCKGDIEKIKEKMNRNSSSLSKRRKTDSTNASLSSGDTGRKNASSSAATAAPAMDRLSIPRNSFQASGNNASRSAQKAYEIGFDTHAPLGAYFVTEDRKCKVYSIYKGGQFKKDPRLALGTIVDSTMIGSIRHPVKDHKELRAMYVEADKKPAKKLRLVFINTEVASSGKDRNLALPQEDWTGIGHWQGKIRHGWAGGAPTKGLGNSSRTKPIPQGIAISGSLDGDFPSTMLNDGGNKSSKNTTRARETASSRKAEELMIVTSNVEPQHREILASNLNPSFKKYASKPKSVKFRAKISENRFFEGEKIPMQWIAKSSELSEEMPPGELSEISQRVSAEPPEQAFLKAVKNGTYRNLIDVLEAGCACDRRVAFKRLQEQYNEVKEYLHLTREERQKSLSNYELKSREKDLSDKKTILNIYLNSCLAIEDAVSLHSRVGLEIRLKSISIEKSARPLGAKRTEVTFGKVKIRTRDENKGNDDRDVLKLGSIPHRKTAEIIEYGNDKRCVYNTINCRKHQLESRDLKLEIYEGDEDKDVSDPLRLASFTIPLNDIERRCPTDGSFVDYSPKPSGQSSHLTKVEAHFAHSTKVEIHLAIRRCKTSQAEKKEKIKKKILEVIGNVKRFNQDHRNPGDTPSKLPMTANIQCVGNVSLLHAAIELYEVQLVKDLLELGANPFARSRLGNAKTRALRLRAKAEEKCEHKQSEETEADGHDTEGDKTQVDKVQREIFESCNRIVDELKRSKVVVSVPQKYVFRDEQPLDNHARSLEASSETEAIARPSSASWSESCDKLNDISQTKPRLSGVRYSSLAASREPGREDSDIAAKRMPSWGAPRRQSTDTRISKPFESSMSHRPSAGSPPRRHSYRNSQSPENSPVARQRPSSVRDGVPNIPALRSSSSERQSRRGSSDSESRGTSRVSHSDGFQRSSSSAHSRGGSSSNSYRRESDWNESSGGRAELPDLKQDWVTGPDRCYRGDEPGACIYLSRGNCRFWHAEPWIRRSIPHKYCPEIRNGLDPSNIQLKRRSGWYTAAYTDIRMKKIIYAQGGRECRVSHEGVFWYPSESAAKAALEDVVGFVRSGLSREESSRQYRR